MVTIFELESAGVAAIEAFELLNTGSMPVA
jgi:hypothetical protein